jgi:hypothetical protein
MQAAMNHCGCYYMQWLSVSSSFRRVSRAESLDESSLGLRFEERWSKLFCISAVTIPVILGGVDTDSVRLMESTVLNTEGKIRARNEQLLVCPVT